MGRGKKRKAAQAAAAAAGIVSSGKLGGTVKGDKNEENGEVVVATLSGEEEDNPKKEDKITENDTGQTVKAGRPTTGGKSLEKIREVLEQKPKKKKRAAQERINQIHKAAKRRAEVIHMAVESVKKDGNQQDHLGREQMSKLRELTHKEVAKWPNRVIQFCDNGYEQRCMAAQCLKDRILRDGEVVVGRHCAGQQQTRLVNAHETFIHFKCTTEGQRSRWKKNPETLVFDRVDMARMGKMLEIIRSTESDKKIKEEEIDQLAGDSGSENDKKGKQIEKKRKVKWENEDDERQGKKKVRISYMKRNRRLERKFRRFRVKKEMKLEETKSEEKNGKLKNEEESGESEDE